MKIEQFSSIKAFPEGLAGKTSFGGTLFLRAETASPTPRCVTEGNCKRHNEEKYVKVIFFNPFLVGHFRVR